MANWQAIVSELPVLRRYARALARDSERADDLVQTTIEKAARKWPQYSQHRNLRPWLFQILHNQFVDEFRRNQRQVDLVGGEDVSLSTSNDSAVSALHIDLESALRQLNDDYLEIFLLACLEEFSYKEISKILHLPIGTVMSRLARARIQLRSILQPYHAGESNVEVLDPVSRQKVINIDKEGTT